MATMRRFLFSAEEHREFLGSPVYVLGQMNLIYGEIAYKRNAMYVSWNIVGESGIISGSQLWGHASDVKG